MLIHRLEIEDRKIVESAELSRSYQSTPSVTVGRICRRAKGATGPPTVVSAFLSGRRFTNGIAMEIKGIFLTS